MRLFVLASLVALVSCGGASEERVAALEAQLAQLQSAAAAPAGGGGGDLEPRLATLESNTAESVKKMEEMLEVLQREVTGWAAKNDAPAADATAASGGNGSGHGQVWASVDDVLGVGGGVQADGDTFTVSKGWLASQIGILAASGKAPKVAANKKGGVSVKGVKPKTLPDSLGLKNNDVILAVGDKDVASPEDLSAALKRVSGGTVVKVMRKKKEVVLTYKVVD